MDSPFELDLRMFISFFFASKLFVKVAVLRWALKWPLVYFYSIIKISRIRIRSLKYMLKFGKIIKKKTNKIFIEYAKVVLFTASTPMLAAQAHLGQFPQQFMTVYNYSNVND